MIVDFPGRSDVLVRQGQRLADARLARGFSLNALAKDAGIGTDRLDAAEHGRTRLTACELHALINALHLPLGVLF